MEVGALGVRELAGGGPLAETLPGPPRPRSAL